MIPADLDVIELPLSLVEAYCRGGGTAFFVHRLAHEVLRHSSCCCRGLFPAGPSYHAPTLVARRYQSFIPSPVALFSAGALIVGVEMLYRSSFSIVGLTGERGGITLMKEALRRYYKVSKSSQSRLTLLTAAVVISVVIRTPKPQAGRKRIHQARRTPLLLGARGRAATTTMPSAPPCHEMVMMMMRTPTAKWVGGMRPAEKAGVTARETR